MAVLTIGPVACNQAPHDAPLAGDDTARALSQAAAASGAARFSDTASGVRFALPFEGIHAAVEHYDASLPAEKIRHSITLDALGSRLVRVDVWDNPRQLPLQAWFDTYLSFTVTNGATAEHRLAGKSRVDAIIVDQPRSPQSEARRLAVFALGSQVVRVTCFDADDTRSVETFDRVLASFEREGAR